MQTKKGEEGKEGKKERGTREGKKERGPQSDAIKRTTTTTSAHKRVPKCKVIDSVRERNSNCPFSISASAGNENEEKNENERINSK